MNTTTKSNALSTDLNSFIYGVSRRNFQNAPELTKIGITLLKNFPAARDAVLEYFAMVFHEAVNVSLNQSDYEPDSGAVSSLESVSMIGPELCGLGPAWAPFIAPWCIKLLVDIATEKANLPNVTLQNSDPVRVLLDITTQNLTLLDSEERSKCIDMMLSCRFCSWAVGWVGRAEPALVAPRALALGADAARAVLAHLANHAPALLHVREALLQLFHEAISTDSKPDKRRDVIPYLLNLASKSDIVLKALIQDIDKTLTDAVMERLTAVCAAERHGPAWEAVGPAALVALLQRADIHCFLLLLRQAAKYLFCRQLTEYLLQKLEIESLLPDKKIPLLQSASEEMFVLRETVLTGTQLEKYSAARIIILVCYNLPSEFVNTISYLLQYSRNDTTLALLVRIISGTITMHTPNDSPDINMDTERYQNLIKTGIEYALRESMHSDTVIKKCYVDGTAPKDRKTYTHHFCLNIIKLLRWESSGRVPHMAVWSVSASAGAGAAALGGALGGRASALRERVPCEPAGRMQAHALAEVLDKLDFSGNKLPPPSVEVIIKVIQATVKYFFMCLHEEEIMDKLRGTQRACRLLRKLCLHSKLARAIALRDLLETAMFREEATFGSKNFIGNTTSAALDWANDDLLMHLNQKHGPITQLTQSHTSVFHAGIIGKGVRRVNADEQNEIPDILTTNNELLMGALMSCMDGNSGIVEGMTAVSLLLVELISPDVMYNGLPWPDEDFTKQVSIERELYMRAALEGCVVARAALRRAAQHRPALCLASALLRACAASALHRHRAADDRYCMSAEMRRERSALSELLATMSLGQLLPPPLCHMLQLAPALTSSELVQILRDCLWNYTRDNVPSPALFECDATGLHWRDPASCVPPPSYTDALRIIIQKRIARLGHLYPLMFLNLEKSDSNLAYLKQK
ncbi:integrator complex subunit 5 [Plutella xylostella]|uniref:integrator complex subunit 5 n=1 Tax=Plutella xylostella TaxID=51655 RepID=UPI002032AC30|nr:integrator complex subunit 5 [Plutella xylostella]